MQFDLTSEQIEKFKLDISLAKDDILKERLAELHAVDIADIFYQLNFQEVKKLYKLLDDEKAGNVLIELEDELKEDLLLSFTTKEIAEQIDQMDSDDAADVINELPENIQDEVLSHIEDHEQASDIADLLNYEEGTAGSLMAKELVSVNSNDTVESCMQQIRAQAKDVHIIYAVYVIDENEKLLGILSLRNLIVSESEKKIGEICDANIITVKTNTPSNEVVEIMEKYDLVVLPVIDSLGRLMGRITIDDVVDVMKEEAEKDIQRMSGITGDVNHEDKIWRLSRARIPWLLVGMGGGIIASRIIGVFQSELETQREMVFFIPLIGATGGNVGVQSSAIIVQGLANNTLLADKMAPKLLKELGVGLVNGMICASLILAYNLIVSDSLALAATVSIALLTVVLFASFLGTFVPLTMNKFKINPALATGPFVTTLNDILGITIYFLVGKLLYNSF